MTTQEFIKKTQNAKKIYVSLFSEKFNFNFSKTNNDEITFTNGVKIKWKCESDIDCYFQKIEEDFLLPRYFEKLTVNYIKGFGLEINSYLIPCLDDFILSINIGNGREYYLKCVKGELYE